MAGQKLTLNNSICFIDYHDGVGSANIGGKKYLWEFHEYLGPTFLRKDGGTKHTVNAMLKQGKTGWHLDLNTLKLYRDAK